MSGSNSVGPAAFKQNFESDSFQGKVMLDHATGGQKSTCNSIFRHYTQQSKFLSKRLHGCDANLQIWLSMAEEKMN